MCGFVYNDEEAELKKALIFDADCGICKRFAQYAENLGLETLPNYSPEVRTFGISFQQTLRRAYLVDRRENCVLEHGHRAIGLVMTDSSLKSHRVLGRTLLIRPLSPIWAAGYWIFANFLRKYISSDTCSVEGTKLVDDKK